MSEKNGGSPKIGAGHLEAMGRQGLRELRAAMYTDSNVAQQPEYGLYGTRTPGEVAQDRRDAVPDEGNVYGPVVSERLRQAEMRHDPSSDRSRNLDRDD